MEQTSSNTPNVQMDVDWSSEVRYPDVPSQQAAAQSQTAAPAQTVQPVAQSASPYYHLSYDALRGDDFPSLRQDSLDMDNPLTQEEMANPTSNSEVYQASLKSLLARNLGYYVVATFQMGSQGTVSVPGILHTVGNDYIVLYQPENGRYVTGDLYALKFVDFHETQSIPRNNNR